MARIKSYRIVISWTFLIFAFIVMQQDISSSPSAKTLSIEDAVSPRAINLLLYVSYSTGMEV